MPEKRPAQDGAMVLAPAKKQRNEMVILNNSSKQLVQVSVTVLHCHNVTLSQCHSVKVTHTPVLIMVN